MNPKKDQADKNPIEKDPVADLVETRESRRQERCPEEPAPLMSGPAPQPRTGTDSTREARSAHDGQGGAPGAAPVHPVDDQKEAVR